MGVFFGTDGLRGCVNDDLSSEVAYKCGNALGSKYAGAKVLIGKDTRQSGDLLLLAFACGLVNSGCDVVSVGVCPTAGVSYLTKNFGYDFGVVISASHNPAEFNGIKIFDREGRKLGDRRETELEKLFLKEKKVPFDKLGKFSENFALVEKYKDFLVQASTYNFNGIKVVLDMSNGASSFVAPEVFSRLGADVIVTNASPNGKNINKNCGSLYIEGLQNKVVETGANFGFAFDGDSDRIIAVDELGNVVDGDKIVYLFATTYQDRQMLEPPMVVGTSQTNIGVENALRQRNIELIRTDVGDKYVDEKLMEFNLLIGGEQSGHVFVKDKLCTGDGVLNAVLITCICCELGKKLSEFFNFKMTHQANLSVRVLDKTNVIGSEKLAKTISKQQQILGDSGRILVRCSGTEPIVRVMVESIDKSLAQKCAKEIEKLVLELDQEFAKCVE